MPEGEINVLPKDEEINRGDLFLEKNEDLSRASLETLKKVKKRLREERKNLVEEIRKKEEADDNTKKEDRKLKEVIERLNNISREIIRRKKGLKT